MNKREHQRVVREKKRQEAERRDKFRQFAWKTALVVLVPLLIIGILYGVLGQGRLYAPDEVAATDHVRGNPDGVTVVVYADFQCPACAREHFIMSQAWPRIRDNAQLVFRHYPLSSTHRHAWTAALYAEAAGQQGQFWEMHDLLFSNQAHWSALPDVVPEFDAYLEQLGLDLTRARRDMTAEATLQKIRNDQRGGTRAGVRSTPALFINGRLTPVPSNAVDMARLINQAAS